jgi:hypothetical protein
LGHRYLALKDGSDAKPDGLRFAESWLYSEGGEFLPTVMSARGCAPKVPVRHSDKLEVMLSIRCFIFVGINLYVNLPSQIGFYAS